MSKEFNWETAEYPCFGVADEVDEVVCFSEYGVGHVGRKNCYVSTTWNMALFKPYTQPKPKTKLWYWEYLDIDNEWYLSSVRKTEEEAKERFNNDKSYRKLEALGFIEVEE